MADKSPRQADNKQSREVVGIDRIKGGEEWELIAGTADGNYYAISEREFARISAIFMQGRPTLDFSEVMFRCYADGAPIRESMVQGVDLAKEDSDFSAMRVKLDVDVSEAITGLKALQRELRETAKAVREMEQAYKDAEKVIKRDNR